jgi:prepilin-type N-terminal cleavage/methylation domain-containing protein
MRRNGHSPTPADPGCCSASAFTLIEVIMALAVAALLTAAIASALIGALRAENSARLQQRAATLLQTVQTGLWLAPEAKPALTNLPPDWGSSVENVEQGEGTNLVFWTVLNIWPLSRPTLVFALCRQEQPLPPK